jgi:hypothetical protein
MDDGNDHLFNIDFANEQIDLVGSDDKNGRPYSQGMPVSFIKSFCLEHVFAQSHEEVEFDLALHALDYLEDLECTRRAALRGAAERLAIRRDNWRDVLTANPNAKAWVEDVQSRGHYLEKCYAQVFIGIRIWVCPLIYPTYNSNSLRQWCINCDLKILTNTMSWQC